MKRVGLWAMSVGLMSCVGVGTIELGHADENEHERTCSPATLKGRYLFATTGTLAAGVFGSRRISPILR